MEDKNAGKVLKGYGKTWIFYTDYDIIIVGQKRESPGIP